jgi:hypothetical protein
LYICAIKQRITMKRILILIIVTILTGAVSGQVNESTIKKFNIGVGVSTDIWQGLPQAVSARTINQGSQVFGMYNHRLGESVAYLAAGIGIGVHNFYSNAVIEDAKADSIVLVAIPDNIDYKKSKITLAYVDIPVEFRIKTDKHFRLAFGFKAGYLINSHTKYKGNLYTFDNNGNAIAGNNTVIKERDIKQLEDWRYGPTLRIGYKWINLTAYYQLSKVFQADKGPQIYPVSIGLSVIPY